MTNSDWVPSLARLQSLVLPAGFLLCFLLESIPATGVARSWNVRWLHVVNNVGLWLLTLFVFSFALGNVLLPVMPWMEMNRIGVLYFFGLPIWLLSLLGFLLYDLSDYLFHRLSHEVRWLWLLHAVHHSDNAMDVSTHVRAHPLHFLTAIIWKTVAATAIGVPYWVVILRELLAMPVVQLHHSSVHWPERLDRLLRKIVVTPNMHRVHHSPERRYTDSNYGSLLPWWDKLLGTYTLRPETPGEIMPVTGLTSLAAPYWQSVLGMMLMPIAVYARPEL
jgi:sterol desaturase/sphingolipid hydroxylase (fatty acid hydroxylase superfamily)